MENFVINPKNYREKYIANLNACFGHWGGDAEYEWGLQRQVGKHSADIMLIENEEDGVIAGSAVSYRQLLKKKDRFDIGIMTGSWTLPAARRKGCFTKIINKSTELCEEKGVPYLTAFVTRSNPSSRRLETEGSFLFPSFHLFSPTIKYEGTLPEVQVVNGNDLNREHLYQAFIQKQNRFLSFFYSPEDFFGQYLDRIKETTVLKLNNDYAVIENGVEEVKILLLTYSDLTAFEENIKAVTNWCLKNRSMKAFYFTTRKELFSICDKLGFDNVDGFFTILETAKENEDIAKIFEMLDINMGDKM